MPDVPTHDAGPRRRMLLDTASLYFRAFFGVPETLAADGTPVNAVRGLLDFIARLVEQYRPDELVCCWDDDWRPQWRVDLIPSYKAHRLAEGDQEEVPPALAVQVPVIREVLAAYGIAVVGAPGCEADDVIGTLTARSAGPVMVVTGDRDLFQLVDDARGIRVLYTARGVGNHDVVDEAWVRTKYGVEARQYADFATLRGDTSDGLPGVKGIGEKTAAALLIEYGTLDVLQAAAGDPATSLKPAARKNLLAATDYLAVAPRVVAVARDAVLPEVPLALPDGAADPASVAVLAERYALGSSATRLSRVLAGHSTTVE